MGKISVVGIGPGSLDDMTYRARRTIEEATTVVGYKRYVDLIAELIDGKTVLDTGMTQEIDRCRAALKEASAGENVVVISSGDAGIYGMAGLVLELLVKMDDSEKPEFGGVIPGVSAMSAAAGLLGAPIMHDFVVISLSDLLTPSPIIPPRHSDRPCFCACLACIMEIQMDGVHGYWIRTQQNRAGCTLASWKDIRKTALFRYSQGFSE